MSLRHSRRMRALAAVAAVVWSAAALGQSCTGPFTLPATAILSPASPEGNPKPGDCTIGVGSFRAVETSNYGCEVRCLPNGEPKNTPVPLYGSDVNSAMFKLTGSIGGFQVFDPVCVYDGFSNRFWIVALEIATLDTVHYSGRIHVAVSKTATPNNCGTGAGGWHKYTQDGAHAALDPFHSVAGEPLDDLLGVGAFPDRDTIEVDEKYLYVTIRKGVPGLLWQDSVSYVMIIDKTPMLTGAAASIAHAAFLDNTGPDKTVGHCLFTDYDIVNEGVYKVYMVCEPRIQSVDAGVAHTTLWFSALQYDPTQLPQNRITYNITELTIPDVDPGFDERFRGVSGPAPEGPSGVSEINGSMFFSACTRRVGSTRELWAIHHVRKYEDVNEVSSKVQWYRITPNNFPSGTPVIDVVKRKDLGASTWAHDGSIASNANGDVAVSYTRPYDLTGGDLPFGWPDFCMWLVPVAGLQVDSVVVGHQAASVDGPSWLDYSGTAPDRGDPCIFWGHSLVSYDTNQWQSWIAKYAMPGCAP